MPENNALEMFGGPVAVLERLQVRIGEKLTEIRVYAYTKRQRAVSETYGDHEAIEAFDSRYQSDKESLDQLFEHLRQYNDLPDDLEREEFFRLLYVWNIEIDSFLIAKPVGLDEFMHHDAERIRPRRRLLADSQEASHQLMYEAIDELFRKRDEFDQGRGSFDSEYRKNEIQRVLERYIAYNPLNDENTLES